MIKVNLVSASLRNGEDFKVAMLERSHIKVSLRSGTSNVIDFRFSLAVQCFAKTTEFGGDGCAEQYTRASQSDRG